MASEKESKKVRLENNHLESISCPVCAEVYALNKIKQSVKCEFCLYKCCRGCILRFVQVKDKEAGCMNCSTAYTDKFKVLFEIDDSVYIKKRLLDAEKLRLPLSVVGAQKLLAIEKMQEERSVVVKQIAELRKQEEELVRLEKQLKQQIQVKQKEPLKMPDHLTERQCFMQDCPGFLSNATAGQLTCIICENALCTTCLDERRDNHVCLKASVLSVQVILEESTTCPWCFVQVQKTADCNDIFCTVCKKGFHYRTGKKILGKFHNPYQIPAALNTAEYNYWVDLHPVKLFLTRLDERLRRLNILSRLLNELNVRIDTKEGACNVLRDQEPLRIKFILKRISEAEWADDLFTRRQELHQLLQELTTTIQLRNVIFQGLSAIVQVCRSALVQSTDVYLEVDKCIANCEAARQTTNQAFMDIRLTYKEILKVAKVTADYELIEKNCSDKSVSCEIIRCVYCKAAAYSECEVCSAYLCLESKCESIHSSSGRCKI